MSSSQPLWTDIAVAVTAVVAILLSGFSLYYARASLALSQEQDRRRKPKLILELLAGDYTSDISTGDRTYHIRLSIRNTSDSDNAIARIEFRLTYSVQTDSELTVRFSATDCRDNESIAVPLRIAAHETVAGWCHFRAAAQTIKGKRIERYEVELTDTHGETVSIVPLILSERRDAR